MGHGPTFRQTMLEVVPWICCRECVDDVHIIIANSLAPKMTPGK
jgi:hypothetical protein